MKDENSFMSAEYCYFDGNFKKMKSFVTLTASVYIASQTGSFGKICSVSRKTKKILKFPLAYLIKPTRKCMVMMKSSSQLTGALTWDQNTSSA